MGKECKQAEERTQPWLSALAVHRIVWKETFKNTNAQVTPSHVLIGLGWIPDIVMLGYLDLSDPGDFYLQAGSRTTDLGNGRCYSDSRG